MTEALKKPQIITLETKSLDYTPYDVKWIPCSARFVVLGQHARGTGAMNVYELEQGKALLVQQSDKKHAIKCGTFGASTLQQRHLATGDFEGNLNVYDLDRPDVPVFAVKAHESIINCIDGCGGVGVHTGPPEIVTGSRDGLNISRLRLYLRANEGIVKVWDVRQKEKPVAVISPSDGEAKRDVWTVAFGNSYNDEERVLCSGYENGDVKMFDLKTMSQLWETNTKNGVCSIEFDRKDIQMNKLVVTSVESSFQLFDLRTQHPTHGFTSLNQKNRDNTTIWTVRHLPQNRDIFITSSGSGSLNVFKYNYPSTRVAQDPNDKKNIGVVGTVELLNNATLAEQPISAFDWSPDKPGLCVFSAFDQQVRVAIVTKLG